jgi:hypothetical protein
MISKACRDVDGAEIGRMMADDDLAFGRLIKTDTELRMLFQEEAGAGTPAWAEEACIQAYRDVYADRAADELRKDTSAWTTG